jgi:hypothetical protein
LDKLSGNELLKMAAVSGVGWNIYETGRKEQRDKREFVPVCKNRAMKTNGGWGKPLRFLNLDTGWRRMVSFTFSAVSSLLMQ